MEGICTAASERERKLYLSAYCQRFNLGSILSVVIAQSTMYRFHPTWLKYTDNRRNLGYKFEITLPEP